MNQPLQGTLHTFEQLINEDLNDESHIEAFSRALQLDDQYFEHNPDSSSPATPGSPVVGPSRIRKVAALSDFAPVNTKVPRLVLPVRVAELPLISGAVRRNKRYKHKRHDFWFLLLRWPLLLFIFLFIGAEFGLYVLVRQLVNGKEWISAWRGKKGRLRKKLRAAQTYEEWKEAAAEMDNHLQFDEWKKVDEDPFYDWKLVRKVKRSLRNLRDKNDARGCLGVLETCIRPNFAAVESPRIYSETFLGTKDLIESYFNELERSLEYVRKTPELSLDEKKRFFKSANTNLGVSALCLSGGGTLGYYHFGVIKAFLDQGILPRVITGTSAGGLIAALTCTRTDEELKVLLVPELAQRITACEDPISVWFKRFMNTGARFDSIDWARKACQGTAQCAYFTRGSTTFKEAYLRTGRILNISVVPADRYSPTKVLNYITAPDTVIWSALLASAAVPGILNPVVLMQKMKDGNLVPWNWGSRFKDGSLKVYESYTYKTLLLTVTNPVVSQANPHVHLFFFAPRGSAGRPVAHRKGKGWRGNFLLSAGEQWLKHELTKNFRVIRDLELLPTLLGSDLSTLFLQRFDGSVTIWPRTRFMDFVRILTDPDPPELDRMLRVGQLVTWPKLHMISNRARIENQILLGRQSVRAMSRSQGHRLPPSKAVLLHSVHHNEGETNKDRRSSDPSYPPANSERPMSVDTDAEEAFVHGSEWFYRRGRTDKPTSLAIPNTKEELSRDPLSSPGMRRKWASGLLNPEGSDGEADRSRRSSQAEEKPTTNSSRFFKKLPSLRGSHSSVFSDHNNDEATVNWSSESSDEFP
ncbi:hypothetical protein AGABI2DRAFT_117271 [Agaricus bisporus var. bisporus H97]|uniref:hypothetical protein n=1 Tax=Agaricus bisporus var. bisporus (strain H97 / ATCC MYA-4626 / FGSC 10389) TaxID=936046 RepID=UPI00029F6227|nr:hypothetical protein AGABI2DRAFT_117271 [Agaricus bisporus var. bisporus H97]EKV48450.1 hypothetical protein AGABI2DRAFT_117271 [Agaricus bisporus var. bisporus H97]